MHIDDYKEIIIKLTTKINEIKSEKSNAKFISLEKKIKEQQQKIKK